MIKLVFSVLTIVMLFHFISADVKPLTLQSADNTNDQIKPIAESKDVLLKRITRTHHKSKGGYSGNYGGGGCSTCGGGISYQPQPQPHYPQQICNTCGQGGNTGSFSSSQSSAQSSSYGYGKKK